MLTITSVPCVCIILVTCKVLGIRHTDRTIYLLQEGRTDIIKILLLMNIRFEPYIELKKSCKPLNLVLYARYKNQA